MTDKPALVIDGMHGMGDNLHQRAIVRQLMQAYDVWLYSSWGALYHDLIADGLKVMRKPIRLRTQMKNQTRESEQKYFTQKTPPRAPSFRFMYHGQNVTGTPSHTILEAMFRCAPAPANYADADYRLPVPDEWKEPAKRLLCSINGSGKPVLIYRPLTERPEWRGGAQRNADPQVYAQLFAMIRDNFFVISVADLQPGREWIVGPHLIADKSFHNGELPFEHLAGLYSQADLVYTSSGHGAILAPAVGKPVVSIVGGYERAAWHASGAKFAPYLGIEPINPCQCSTSMCGRACDKRTDISSAKAALTLFIGSLGFSANAETRPVSELFTAPPPEAPPSPQLLRAMYPVRMRPGKAPFALAPNTPGVKA